MILDVLDEIDVAIEAAKSRQDHETVCDLMREWCRVLRVWNNEELRKLNLEIAEHHRKIGVR